MRDSSPLITYVMMFGPHKMTHTLNRTPDHSLAYCRCACTKLYAAGAAINKWLDACSAGMGLSSSDEIAAQYTDPPAWKRCFFKPIGYCS